MESTHPRPTSRTTRPRRRLIVSACVSAILLVAVTVSVVSLARATTPSFPDVPASHPYHGAVTDLAGRGIINGYADGTFRPDYPVVRQQFAKMIVLSMGHDVPPGIDCPFTDVDLTPNPVDPLYPAKYVAVCALHGITRGKTATTFDPYANITRFQVISMVVRAVDEVKPGLLLAPPDTFAPTWDPSLSPQHGQNAARAEYNGLLAGIDLAHRDPEGDMPRGETAQVLHNVLVKVTPVTTTLTSTTAPPTTAPPTTVPPTTVPPTTEPPTTSSSSTTEAPTSSTTTTVPHEGWEDLGGGRICLQSGSRHPGGRRVASTLWVAQGVGQHAAPQVLRRRLLVGVGGTSLLHTAQPGSAISRPRFVGPQPHRPVLPHANFRIFLQQLVWRDSGEHVLRRYRGSSGAIQECVSRATGSIDLFNEGGD